MSPLREALDIYLGVTRRNLSGGLADLTDTEFFWEPVPGCWSVRPAAESAVGGDTWRGWVHERIADPQPPPFTTIAWRLVHLYRLNVMWHDYAFGDAQMRFTEVPVPNTAASAVSSWEDSYDTLWDAAAAVPEDELGREYDFPYGVPGRRRTLAGLLANFLHEHVHHGAEILCLRDLYRVERTS